MTTDNRTNLDACDATGAWAGSTSPALDTANQYEGGGCLTVQATNAYRSWYTTVTSVNLTSCTIYYLVKAGNPQTVANGGIRLIIGDGTNRRAYYVGGNDNYGLFCKGGWSSFRLDTANLPATYSQDLGAAQPTLTAITYVGIGIIQPAKATGNSPNVYIDRICYIANGSAAVTVNGGTSGTPETFADIVGDDETGGWGVINNPITGSKLYGVYGATEWGDTGTADSYFDDSDAQIYFIGTGLSAGTMDVDMIANSTGTNSFVLDNCTVVAVGAISNWDCDDTNHDEFMVTNSQLAGHGTFAFPTVDASKYITGTIFDDCGTITVSTMKFEDNTIRNATGTAMDLANATTHGVATCSFTSLGTGHAIEIVNGATGTYDFDDLFFYGYATQVGTDTDRMVYNNSAGSVTININGGTFVTYMNGASATTEVVQTATLTLTVKDKDGAVIVGARCLIEAGDGSGAAPFEDVVTITRVTTTATVSHGTHGLKNGQMVNIRNSNQPEYNGAGKVITYIDAGSYSYTVAGTPTTPATGTITSTQCFMSELTIAGGIATQAYGTAGVQPYRGVVAHSTTPNLYDNIAFSGTDASGGLSLPIQLGDDT